MKLTHSLLPFLFFAISSFGQGPRFDVKFSEPLAVFVFVEHCSSKYPDNSFKKLFQGSLYNRDKYKKLLAQFDTLRLNYNFEFNEFPYGSKVPGRTESLIKRNLVATTNLKDFKHRSFGVIPNASLLQLCSILYEFQAVYRELVYKPGKDKFEKQLVAVTEFIKTKNIAAYFDKGLAFYKSYWEDSFPFEIALYPYQNNQGITAEAFYNSAISPISADTKDFTALMTVMLHEIFHILYDEQPLQVKKNIDTWFKNNSSPCRTYAYLLMNEAIATSLANGFVFEKLAGKADAEDWYDWKYINLLAKKIYPLVSEYMNKKKPIDEAFVTAYIAVYEENFLGWLTELNNLMCYRYVITDNPADFRVIRKIYPNSYLFHYEHPINENSIDNLKNCPVTKVIIVSKENEAKLGMVKKKIPELKDWKYKVKEDFLFSIFLEDKTQLIIINTVKNSTEQMLTGRVMLTQ